MLYDINITPAQAAKLAEWVETGPDGADVELVVDDSMLLAEQGDDRMAWDTDGSPASDDYLAVAPLDPARTPVKTIIGRERALIDALTKALQAMIGGPPPSKRTVAQVRRHKSGSRWETQRGGAFEVQLVGPDGDVTGHIARVTVEIDRFVAGRVVDRQAPESA
jgi:hypothetical protein